MTGLGDQELERSCGHVVNTLLYLLRCRLLGRQILPDTQAYFGTRMLHIDRYKDRCRTTQRLHRIMHTGQQADTLRKTDQGKGHIALKKKKSVQKVACCQDQLYIRLHHHLPQVPQMSSVCYVLADSYQRSLSVPHCLKLSPYGPLFPSIVLCFLKEKQVNKILAPSVGLVLFVLHLVPSTQVALSNG